MNPPIRKSRGGSLLYGIGNRRLGTDTVVMRPLATEPGTPWRTLGALIALVAGVVTVASAAGSSAAGPNAHPVFGVAEDASKYASDGGRAIYARMTPLGLQQTRWTVTFTGDPLTIAEKPFLDRAVPAAAAAGITVTLSLVPAGAQAPDPSAFCQWAGAVAAAYPTVTSFIIGNEPNATRFWSPQHTATDPDAGANTYEATLARCYDTLKAFNPQIQVIGLALAPRAVDFNSTKPLEFVREVGAAYRASGRTAPIMDIAAVHPYPNPNASPPPPPDSAAYDDPDFFGITQLNRVKQALYDAFAGTGQPTTLTGLKLLVDEIGYQTNENGNPQYTGVETSPTVSEAQQAAYYARVVQLYACDSAVSAVLFFHLIDETNLNSSATSGGWQSGVEYPDGTPKPSSAAVQQAIATGCVGPPAAWHPAVPLSPGLLRSAGLYSGSIRAGVVGGPLGALVTVPGRPVGQLSGAASSQFVSPIALQGSASLDAGRLLWRSTLHARGPVTVGGGVYQLSAPTSATATTLASLYGSATTPAGVANLWTFICRQPGASGYIAGCSATRTSQSAAAHGVMRVAVGGASIAPGGPVSFTLRRSHSVAPGLYVTTIVVRPAGRGTSARLLVRPFLVTAAQLAQPLGR